MIIKQLASILLGGGVVSLLNLFVFFTAMSVIGVNSFSQIVIVVSLFFGCVDLFNSGSSKILIKDEFLIYRKNIVFFDVLLSLCSSIVFLVIFFSLSNTLGLDINFNIIECIVFILLFFIYLSTQFHLGYLRYKSLNHFISFLLLLIPLLRLIVIFLYNYKVLGTLECLTLVWLSVEIIPGLFMFFKYLSIKPSNVKLHSWHVFFERYKPYFLSNWSSNVIYSLSKHFDVAFFSFLFGNSYASYYKAIKSVYNIAFNLGGSMIVYVFANVNTKFLDNNRFQNFSMFFSLLMLILFIYSTSFYIYQVDLISFEFFNLHNLLFVFLLFILLFLPTLLARVFHYKIQSRLPILFVILSLVDIFLLFSISLFFYFSHLYTDLIASIFITPFYSVVSFICLIAFYKVFVSGKNF